MFCCSHSQISCSERASRWGLGVIAVFSASLNRSTYFRDILLCEILLPRELLLLSLHTSPLYACERVGALCPVCPYVRRVYMCVCVFISLIHYVSDSKSAVERVRLSVSICQCVSVCNHVTLCKTIWMCQHVWTYLNAHVSQHRATLSTSKNLDETQPFQNSQLSLSL